MSLGFPGGASGKESDYQCRKVVGSIPGSGRSPGGGHSNQLQCSCLENPMDRGAWRATVQRVAKHWTRLKRLSTRAHMSSKIGLKNSLKASSSIKGQKLTSLFSFFSFFFRHHLC